MHQQSNVEAAHQRWTSWRRQLGRLRPGAVLALAVTTVVGGAGILQWNQRMIVIGLVSGIAIVAMNAVVVLVRYWHHRNTQLAGSYTTAEEVVRLRRQRR